MIKLIEKFDFSKLSRALPSKANAKIKAFNQNENGMAAVEFAILSPMMIALYFGLVEISMFIHSDKVTSHATNVAADLATQVSNMDADDVEDVFAAALATMSLKPNQIASVSAEVLSYNLDSSGDPVQIGRATLNGGYTGTAFDPSSISTRLLTPTSGALVARIQYDYESVSFKFVERLTTLEETFILKPRASADIPFSLDGSPGTFTCNSAGENVSCS